MHTPHWSPTPKVPLDRFGQPIGPGDLICYAPIDPIVFRVTEVRGSLDPSTPNVVRLTLEVPAFTIGLPAGTPAPGIHRVGYVTKGPDGQPVSMIGSPVNHPTPRDLGSVSPGGNGAVPGTDVQVRVPGPHALDPGDPPD